MSNTLKAVLLTLVNLAQFQRRDLADGSGLPVTIKRGETIKVTEAIATQLTSDDNVNLNGDDEPISWFLPAKDGAEVTYDFTVAPTPPGELSVAHDMSFRDNEKPISEMFKKNSDDAAVRDEAAIAADVKPASTTAPTPPAPKPAPRTQRKPASK